MKKLFVGIVIAFVFLYFLSFLSSSGIGEIILSSQPLSAKFTACKGILVNLDTINKEREQQWPEPIKPK